MKKRKFFSYLFLGLLTIGATGMVTSCKDYDDDIDNLQDQINKAALKTDLDNLSSQLTQAASTASTAATNAQNALTQANANKTAIDQLNNLATTYGTQVANAINSAAAAQKSADDAATAAAAADTKAQQGVDAAAAAAATANTNAADIATIKQQLQSLGLSTKDYVTATTLKNSIDSLANVLTNIQKDSLNAFAKKVQAYQGGIDALYTAVTEVSLVGTITGNGDNLFTAANFSGDKVGYVLDFNQTTIKGRTVDGKEVATYNFGKTEQSAKQGLSGLAEDADVKTYTKDNTVQDNTDLIIRVNPINAKLDTSMIKLINSTGEDLSKVLTITDVQPYDKVALTRAAGPSKGGLWKVSFQLKNKVTSKDLEEVGVSNDKPILFAVAINNTKAQAETHADAAGRYVISTYDVTLGKISSVTPVTSLDNVKVYDKVTPKDNRDDQYLSSTKGDDGTRAGENYKNKPVAANNGDVIVVDFSGNDKETDATKKVQNVQYFYVVRDDDYATDDNVTGTSEINAWTSYKYDGDLGYADGKGNFLKKAKTVAVNKGTGKAEFTIDLNGKNAGDEVGFRIFAINYDGSLVEKNGASFRVYVADKSQNTTFTGTMHVTTDATTGDNVNTALLPIGGEKLAGTVANLKKYLGDNSTLTFEKASTKQTGITFSYQLLKSDKKSEVTDNDKVSDIAYLKVSLTSAPSEWKDNSTITKTINTLGENGNTENIVKISIQKTIPSTAQEVIDAIDFKWRPEQLEGNDYTAFMQADSWTTADQTEGSNDFVNAWNFKAGTDLSKVELTITGAKYNSTSKKDENNVITGTGSFTDLTKVSASNKQAASLVVKASTEKGGKDYIDNTTERPSTLKYNFGKISSESKENGEVVDYKVPFYSFNTIFACPLAEKYNKYTWTQKNKGTDAKPDYVDVNWVYYSNAGTNSEEALLNYVKVANSSRNEDFIKANTLTQQVALLPSSVTYKLVSQSSGDVDYYNVAAGVNGALTFTPVSTKTNVTKDVPSWLVISGTDAFGHKYEVKLDFTLKPFVAGAKLK